MPLAAASHRRRKVAGPGKPFDPSRVRNRQSPTTGSPWIALICVAAFGCTDEHGDPHFRYGWTQTWGSNKGDFIKALASSEQALYVAGSLAADDPELGDVVWDAMDDPGHTALATFDLDGTPRRGVRLDGTNVESRQRVVTDQAGNVYIASLGAVRELPVERDQPRRFEQHGHVIRFDASGERAWSYDWPVFASSVEIGAEPSLAISPGGDVFVAGMREQQSFAFVARLRGDDGSEMWAARTGVPLRALAASDDAVYLYGRVHALDSANAINAWLRKLDADGRELWTRQWGDGLMEYGALSPAGGPEPAADLCVQQDGGALLVGSYRSLGRAVQDEQGIRVVATRGGTEAFATSFTADGEQRWTLNWGGDKNDGASSVALNPEGTAFVAGWFEDSATMPNGKQLTGFGLEALVVEIGPDGDYRGAHAWGGAGKDLAYGVQVLADGALAVAGSFENLVDFGLGGEHNIRVSNGFTDAYLTRWDFFDLDE
jgi:hypothetical protein